MSRLTGSPFGKPTPFEFPRHGLPPSPPETHRETLAGVPHVLSAPSFGAQDFFPIDAALASSATDHFGGRSSARKTSSIPYHSSPVAARETHRPTLSRHKMLILVLPPSTLLQEPGPSSQGASNTPFHRLSQGVLLPLLPSLFSQLTAIAKEFNFPSTSGLVLYYHIVDGGISFTPRISEDSWQSIWSNLSEPQERQPLISGKIEFDIDLRLARWYPTWLSALRREVYEYTSTYHPSTAPSMAHFTTESRTTMADRTMHEDDLFDVLQQSSRTATGRHVRKLSLVEKLDGATVKGAISPPASNPSRPRPLSTIAQEDESKTAEKMNRVENWRASAVIAPAPLATTGQPSLDPVNLPNNMDVPSPFGEEEEEMRMSDFQWSISSAGPLSPVDGSASSWSRVPSIDIARRMEGSVASTVSYRTSSGPSDYDPVSPTSWSYPPSIHLANRLEGSVCSTVSYQTSFGPADYDPYSPVIAPSRLPTPDIARRFFEDCPSTPQTATSWGAPSWPPSPRCSSLVPSLDLGERLMYDVEGAPRTHYSREVAGASGPSTEEKPWEHGWPYFKSKKEQEAQRPWQHGWPYFEPEEEKDAQPWQHGWPYFVATDEGASQPWQHNWPYFNSGIDQSPQPWKYSWPYFKSEEGQHVSGQEIKTDGVHKPWDLVWPYTNYTAVEDSVKPWSHAWPYFKSGEPSNQSNPSMENPLTSASSYPNLRIYAPVYPHLEIYPPVPGALRTVQPVKSIDSSLSVRAPVSYPAFDLYPAVYPYNLDQIYPDIQTAREPVGRAEGYPYFNLYPAKTAPLHSYLSLYLTNPRGQYPHFEIYPASGKVENVASPSQFAMSTSHAACYPAFNLYPAVYPNFDLYPAPYYEGIVARTTPPTHIEKQNLVVISSTAYPSFNLYPAVYPYFDLYPAPYFSNLVAEESSKQTAEFTWRYPVFDLYPAVYPDFDLYPAVLTEVKPPTSPRARPRPTSRLPVPSRSLPSPVRTKSTSRLTHSELHAMVMMEKYGSSLSPVTPPRRIESRHIPTRSFSSEGGGISGLPSSPASSLRRQVSLADRRMTYMQSAGASLTSPPTRRPSQRQSVFGAKTRDSLVLQKARAFDTSDPTHSPSSSRESLSRFPLPPRSFPPPLGTLPPVPAERA